MRIRPLARPRTRVALLWIAFLLLNDNTRARQFGQLDSGSDWAHSLELSLLLREGRVDLVEKDIRDNDRSFWQLLRIRKADIEGQYRRLKTVEMGFRDGEPTFFYAEIAAAAGFDQGALDMLRTAVDRHKPAASG